MYSSRYNVYSINEIMNSLKHAFAYDNVAEYSWYILDMVEEKEDKLYIRVASKNSDQTADCTIHIYPTLDKVSAAAYNFVLSIRNDDGYVISTNVGLFDFVINHAHVLDCLLAASELWN